MIHETGSNGQWPEDHGALTREELLTYAQAFAGEVIRWKVWYVQGYAQEPAQATLAEAQAIQALSLVLIELLADAIGTHTRAKTEFATVAAFLGYVLPDTPGKADMGRPALQPASDLWERQDDAVFLRQYGLKFLDDAHPDEA